MIIIVVPWMKPAGMALYPFILVNRPAFKNDTVLIRHEQIHLRQQKELFVLPFYLVYLLCYGYNFLRYCSHHMAYLQIPFEREAYRHEKEPDYLLKRKKLAWLRST